MADAVLFAQMTGAVRWSAGTTILRAGQRFATDDPLVTARPDLFGSADPTQAPRSTVPAAHKRQCWSCPAEFTLAQNHQRYCSPKCRRARERALTRAARRAVAGAGGDPSRPSNPDPKRAHAYREEVQSRLDELVMLANHLAGRADPRDPGRLATDTELRAGPGGNRPAFARLVRDEVERVTALRNSATDLWQNAIANHTRAQDIQANLDTFGPGNSAQRRAEQQRQQWGEQLGQEE